MKKLISITLSVVLMLTAICVYTPQAQAKGGSSDEVDMSGKILISAESSESEKLEPVEDLLFEADNKDEDSPGFVENEAIITLSVPEKMTSPLLSEGVFSEDKRIYIKDVMSFGTFYAVHVSSEELTAGELMDILSEYPYVKNAEPNYRLTQAATDPLMSEQWYLDDKTFHPGSTHSDLSQDADIAYRKEIHSLLPTGSAAPIVAVIDTGVDYTHEDLKDKMWINPYPSLPGICGYDFCNKREDPFPTSVEDTHGTSVAGIIAATTDNGIGISGISRDARILSLKIFDSDSPYNSGSTALQLAAYEYIYKAKKLGANIVAANCSFCMAPSANPYSSLGSGVLGSLDAAINRLGEMGVLFVYAAGNESENIGAKPYGVPYQQDQTYLMVTGATNYRGEVASYSNRGVNHVHLMAPGSTILTTTTRDNFLAATYDENKKNRLCLFREDFPTGKTTLLREKNNSCIATSHSTDDIHGDPQSGSGVVTIKNAYNKDPDNYTVYYDITDYPINYDGTSKYYYSFVCQVSGKGGAAWYDVSGTIDSDKIVKAWYSKTTGHNYLSINLKKLFGSSSLVNGISICFDSLAISVANPNTSEFGKYTYANGTSFSAPCVSGAIARLSTVLPNSSASYRKQFILENVLKNPAYEGICSSGGTLNMSAFPTAVTQLDNPTVLATGIKLNKTSARLKSGKRIKLKAKVLPVDAADKKINWKVNKKAYASVSKKGVVKAKKKGRGHTVKVTAYLASNKKIKKICKVKIR